MTSFIEVVFNLEVENSFSFIKVSQSLIQFENLLAFGHSLINYVLLQKYSFWSFESLGKAEFLFAVFLIETGLK